eukprot:122877-Rhodomonas_salina.4
MSRRGRVESRTQIRTTPKRPPVQVEAAWRASSMAAGAVALWSYHTGPLQGRLCRYGSLQCQEGCRPTERVLGRHLGDTEERA